MTTIEVEKIIRSRRRTVALVITKDATLVVRAGVHTSAAYIEDLVHKKRAWITRKIAEVAGRPKLFPGKFADGERFPYLGNAYPLAIVDDTEVPLLLADGFILSRRCLPAARQVFVDWYREKARAKIQERLDLYASRSDIGYGRCNITGARSRWGSCTAKNTVNFSWRLILAPLHVVDYVIAHELAHVERKDHSRHFWSRVSDIFPGYHESERWLKDHGHSLGL